MSSTGKPTPPPLPTDKGKSWQFSLRTMLLGMTGFAIVCGFAAAVPIAFSQALIGLVWIAATGCVLTGLVFARDDQRAFCIGAAVVISSSWTGIGGRFVEGAARILYLFTAGAQIPEGISLWIQHGVLAVAAVANGWLCVHARRYFERQHSR